MIVFDHIEVHVIDTENYCKFLHSVFGGGRYKKISDNDTYMFLSNDQFHIEVKKSKNTDINNENGIGFCMPCLRMDNALEHLNKLNLEISKELHNPDGPCYFFSDFEGINWHIKSYALQDIYINI